MAKSPAVLYSVALFLPGLARLALCTSAGGSSVLKRWIRLECKTRSVFFKMHPTFISSHYL